MKKQTLLLLGAAILLLASCRKDYEVPQSQLPEASSLVSSAGTGVDRGEENSCDEKTVDLLSGSTVVGSFKIANDEDSVYLTYTTTDNWRLRRTRLYVGACENLPLNCHGFADLDDYPFRKSFSGGGTTTYRLALPVSVIGLNVCGCVSAYAEVRRVNSSGCFITGSRRAWGAGDLVNPATSCYNNGATKTPYCAVSCE